MRSEDQKNQTARRPGRSLWRNRKTGDLYWWLAAAIDATNSRDGTPVVVYCPADDEHTIYVRELEQFERKFELVDNWGTEPLSGRQEG